MAGKLIKRLKKREHWRHHILTVSLYACVLPLWTEWKLQIRHIHRVIRDKKSKHAEEGEHWPCNTPRVKHMRCDGVVVNNTLVSRPRGPGFNPVGLIGHYSKNEAGSCGQAVNSPLPWRGYEAVHGGCYHWFEFTMWLHCPVTYAFIITFVCLFASIAVCQWCSLKEGFIYIEKYFKNKNTKANGGLLRSQLKK